MNSIFDEIVKGLKNAKVKGTITKNTVFRDLGIDSLDLMDLVIKLEDKMNVRIPDDKLNDIKTIADLLEVLEGLK